MTALAQACAGLALAAALAMLCTRQLRAAFLCFVAQSLAVAAAACLTEQPLLALAPAASVAAVWLARRRTLPPPRAEAVIPGLAAGIGLGLLCLSGGDTGLPLGVVLLALVLAAVRRDPVTQLLAACAMGNGIALGGCLVATETLLPLACLAVPLPIAAHHLAARRGAGAAGWHGMRRDAGAWPGRAELAGAATLFAATLMVPLGALASVFAPLIAFDGMVRAGAERFAGPPHRAASLLQLGCVLLAVGAPDPMLSWLAVAAAATVAMLPAAAEHPDRAMLAAAGAGLALFGTLTLPVETALTGYLALFAGYALLAAAVPDLAVPLVVLLLRSALPTEWPPGAAELGAGVALIGLLACSARLLRHGRDRASGRADILLRAQACIAGLAIATAQPDGRFAAAVLLILLSLTRTASRPPGEPSATIAVAGLAGLPPIGVFPGLVLVGLAVSSHTPWLLPPLSLALVPILRTGLPRRLPAIPLRMAVPSIAWLPLALATLFGLFAPMELVRWLAAVTMGPS